MEMPPPVVHDIGQIPFLDTPSSGGAPASQTGEAARVGYQDDSEPDAADDMSTDQKSALTRARILDSAANILSTKGYAGLRLIDVAASADLQPSTIYYYYLSRDDLIEEVVWAGIAEMRENVVAALGTLPEGTSAMNRILAAAEAHLRHQLQIAGYTSAALRNARQVPLTIRKRQIREEERYFEVWRGLLNELSREGGLRRDLDPYVAQMLVIGALNGTVEWWDSKRDSIDAVVASAQSLIRQGLSTASAP